ncbi:Alpha/Beta hydrolase protein [Pyronema omphalodes]|nr:Alpha/Beta hydrolase protein [Pyronema omphalodes]
MAPKPIDPYNDERVTHEFANVRGKKYHYVHGMPKGKVRATVLTIHGFPDLWYSWRFIIPALLDMGLRVITPDMIGYGQTDAPRCTADNIEPYGWKSIADDMAELLRLLNVPKVILIGHDWGGAIVSRIYLHHPDIVTHIASVCTPYYGLIREYIPIEEYIKKVPTFKYQVAFADPQTEKDLEKRSEIDRFFRAIHRGLGDGASGDIQVTKNFMTSLGDSPRGKLLTQQDLEYYVDQFSRNGFHGPLNYYRNRYQNYLDEKDMARSSIIDVPYLYIAATHDIATPPSLAKTVGQARNIPNLVVREVKSSHWALVECPDEVIVILDEWINTVCLGNKAML